MAKKYGLLIFITLSIALSGCGGDDNSNDDGSSDQTAQDAKVQATATCGSQVCNQNQYCFQEVKVNCDNTETCDTYTETTLYSACMPRPSNCDSCDCAQNDALAQESGMCQSGAACEQNRVQDNSNLQDAIKVSCYQGLF